MKKVFIFILFFFGICFAEFENISGAELLPLGVSPSVLGAAGQMATEDRELDALSINPLVAARHIYQNVNLSYLGFSQLGGYHLGYVLPLPPGVFGLSLRGYLSDQYELDQYHSLGVQFAKEVSTRFTLGTSFNIDIFHKATEIPAGVSIDLALLYKDLRQLKETWGVGEGKYALMVRNLGFSPITTSEGMASKLWLEPIEIRGGVSFAFFHLHKEKVDWDMRLGLDGGIHIYPFNVVFNMAYKNFLIFPKSTFYGLGITLGYLLNLDSIGIPDVGPFTAGVSMKFKMHKNSKSLIHLSYALLPERINKTSGVLHTLSLNLEIGKKDEKAPEIDTGNIDTRDLIKDADTTDLQEDFR